MVLTLHWSRSFLWWWCTYSSPLRVCFVSQPSNLLNLLGTLQWFQALTLLFLWWSENDFGKWIITLHSMVSMVTWKWIWNINNYNAIYGWFWSVYLFTLQNSQEKVKTINNTLEFLRSNSIFITRKYVICNQNFAYQFFSIIITFHIKNDQKRDILISIPCRD